MGEILFANLNLSGQNNNLYYFDKEGSINMIKMAKVLKALIKPNKWSETIFPVWYEKHL